MTIFQKLSTIWSEDNLLRRVVRNSSYLFGSNVFSSGLSFLQGVVIIRLIGVANLGMVVIIQTFASNINRLLSFRMSEVVVKHLGPALADDKKPEAAALVKAAGLTEVTVSLLACIVLVFLSPWAARVIAHDPTTTPWFLFYGLILLINLVYETSTGVLQATHRFNHLARLTLIQAILTFSIIGVIYILYRWVAMQFLAPFLVPAVLLAYLIGKGYYNVSLVTLALREVNTVLGKDWWRVSLNILPGKRAMALFALNTNLNGTINLIFRDNIPLYLGALLSTIQVGYFSVAFTLVSTITLILDPFIAPTYSEISRTVAKQQWDTTLRLLRRVTVLSGGIILAIGGFWALTGWWLIPFIYKPQMRPAYPLLLILLLGYGVAGVFQWNRSLMLSLGKAGYPVLVMILTGVIELALILALVPRYGYLMMGAILSGYFILSNGFISLRGLLEVRRRQMAGAG
ncbi:MAG TPA: oligosaccharide flippase family protein [Anaerolineales bacterium]|nr:oligosaccharide flippase family protein [Anaerolineales bacterium]